jgi:uncharacterized membrane protein YkvA (DUF1232 family)
MMNLGSGYRSRLTDMFNRSRRKFDGSNLGAVCSKAGRLISQMERKGVPDGLIGIWEDIRDMYLMLRDSIAGRYSVPFRTLAAVAVTLLYLANPFDLIPDFIPGIGFIDDVFMVSLCLKFISADLEEYREWRNLGETGEDS